MVRRLIIRELAMRWKKPIRLAVSKAETVCVTDRTEKVGISYVIEGRWSGSIDILVGTTRATSGRR
jgi:hypothetical protein